MAVCAVIPFFNEIKTLKRAVKDSLEFVDKVIAIDDGSDDNSICEIENITNVISIRFPVNKGKGEALKMGFEKAIELKYDKIITLDADLQHNPQFIPQILTELNKFDIVIGNRLNDLKNMPLQRRLSNRITSSLLSIKTGQKILDAQCGFRGYRFSVLELVKTKYSGFEAESEILVSASRKGFKIGFIEIPTIYRGSKSKMRAIRTIIGFLKILIHK